MQTRQHVAILAALSITSCTHSSPGPASRSIATIKICNAEIPINADGISCYSPTKDDHQGINRFTNVHKLDLLDIRDLSRGSDALEHLPHLNKLTITADPREALDEEFFVETGGLNELRSLHIPRSAVGDNGLLVLAARFPDISELGLCLTRVTAGGLKHLSLFTHLNFLLLCGKHFDKDALPILGDLGSLASISLVETSIDRESASQFAAAHPDIQVSWAPMRSSEPELLSSPDQPDRRNNRNGKGQPPQK